MCRQNLCLVFVILIFTNQFLFAQKEELIEKGISKEKKISVFSEFEGNDFTSIELKTNLSKLYNDRRYQNYHPSFVTIKFADGDTLQQQIKTKTRGKFRCRNCDYPPIKIKFSKKQLKDNNYKKWNEYKMVYPCKDGQSFQNYIYKEYLAYKIYNILSERSYRVGLVDVTLKDSLKNTETIKFKGFVIEDKDELIKRLDCSKEEVEKADPSELVQEDYAIFQLFQYMIGNTDWIPPIGHNMDMLKNADGKLYPIPFDFDFSGFVETHYAVPNSNFPISSIKERYFMAHKKNLEELTPAIALFKEKKSEIYNLINDFEYLPKSEKAKMKVFLKDFYKTIEKSKKMKKALRHDMPAKMIAFY